MRPHVGRFGPVTWTEVSPNFQIETSENKTIILFVILDCDYTGIKTGLQQI